MTSAIGGNAARVLVIGEALMDVVDEGREQYAHPGGSPLNVACGLGRLEIPTVFATQFADDNHGRALTEHIQASNVQLLRQDAASTSTARARIDSEGSAHYEFAVDWDFQPTELPTAPIVHVGSIGAFREPGGTALRQVLDALPSDTLITFDPNIRAALIPDPERSRELMRWYCARADLVKLSDEDAEWLFPGVPADSVLDRILEYGTAHLAAITLGSRGSIIASRYDHVRVAPLPTTVVDTIGAGDAYMTGLIAGLDPTPVSLRQPSRLDVEGLDKLGRLAAAVAGLTVAQAGANPPTRTQLDAEMNRRLDAAH